MSYKENQMRATLEWFQGVGVGLFNFAILDDSGMIGHARPRDAIEVARSLGWASARNAGGCNVYMRPARIGLDGLSAAWPVIFFDDVAPKRALKIASKYQSMVIRTSPGNCHVWIACEDPLSEAQRAATQGELAPKINADKASTSGEHFGRAPGFKNQKRGGAWVEVLQTTRNCARLDGLSIAGKRADAGGLHTYSPSGGRVARSGGESESDFGFAAGRLSWACEAGRDIESERQFVIRKIAERALARGKRGTERAAYLYALLTTNAAALRIGLS
ncbi:MAG: hypothetical protein GZ085_00355 [Sulfuriferula multivorans]|uniref:RepB-like DNA primase domain-containing protein n=1 Tax=Sulfuriferula multivorans TaxID=1559896 RepID=A0A7C9P487_9PROT|nr:hypothetical protein [Sulfuriferula multivorans]